MSTLEIKLQDIKKPKIKSLGYGKAETLAELWDNLIEQYLPSEQTVAAWNNLLFKYINDDGAVFAIRGYNTFPRHKYDSLRRGFLTNTDKGFSFFYTDNFFAAYFCKMAIDNYCPDYEDFYDLITKRKFPARFGIDTENERKLMAINKGKDPGINSAGFKIAHIIPVGKGYYFGGKTNGIKEILERYFPKGERADWKRRTDNTGTYFVRELKVADNAKEIIAAHFLRFIHPLNYFLAPKKDLESNHCCKEIAENNELLKYAQYRFMKKYGQLYFDYLKLIMYNDQINFKDNGSHVINITYGGKEGLPDKTEATSLSAQSNYNRASKHVNNMETETINAQEIKVPEAKDIDKIDSDTKLLIAIKYLCDPSTSFRKLEKEFLHIESKARGGGFVAKKIVNDFGITAEKKGILSIVSIEEEINNSEGGYHDFLLKLLLPLIRN